MIFTKITNMLTDLKNFFTTSSDSLDRHKCIGVCESKADSGFIFHHFISYFLKNGHRVFLLSFSQSFTHFNNVGNKTGSNLTEQKLNSKLVFIEGLKYIGSAVNLDRKSDDPWGKVVNDEGCIGVNNLYRELKCTIDSFDRSLKPVLIVDDLSLLNDLGVPVKDLIGLIQYLWSSICMERDGCLIVGVNNDGELDDEDGSLLWKALQYQSDVTVEVKGLESGYCRDVHGQITAAWKNPSWREKPTVKEAQFKLTDKTCALFASGMSSAVL